MTLLKIKQFNGDKQLTITIELSGGLANQLFQWSVSKIISSKYGAKLVVDARIVERPDGRGEQISHLIKSNDEFVHESPLGLIFWKYIHRLLPHPAIGAVKRSYSAFRSIGPAYIANSLDDIIADIGKTNRIVMRGLFQESNLLYENKEYIKSLVNLDSSFVRSITNEPYAAIHVRRGDYVDNPKYNNIFGTCSEEFYRAGITTLTPGLPVIIATDDVPWARQFIATLSDANRKISVSTASNHYEDLALLANATELILSNSTFSWWGALMGKSRRTICPEPWFTDRTRDRGLQRDHWIRIPR